MYPSVHERHLDILRVRVGLNIFLCETRYCDFTRLIHRVEATEWTRPFSEICFTQGVSYKLCMAYWAWKTRPFDTGVRF
jgi:hypothetical protein